MHISTLYRHDNCQNVGGKLLLTDSKKKGYPLLTAHYEGP